MKRWIILAFTVLLLGCLPFSLRTRPAFPAPTATPTCQPFSGVTFEVLRLYQSDVTLHATGLQPGEIPSVSYSASSNNASSIGDAAFSTGADQNGVFSQPLRGLAPLPGQTHSTWDIRLIHSRGIECATITLP